MKKITFLFIALILLQTIQAQKYMTRNGFIGFFSHTPVEDIKADNNQVAGILDISTGEMVFQVLMKSFKFERSLMEEHFNENYVESDKFPKATFSGKIVDAGNYDLSKPGKYEVVVEGELTIHGKTNKVSTSGTIDVSADGITSSSKFNIVPEEYDISIPGVVRDKIAKDLEVTVEIKYPTL